MLLVRTAVLFMQYNPFILPIIFFLVARYNWDIMLSTMFLIVLGLITCLDMDHFFGMSSVELLCMFLNYKNNQPSSDVKQERP